MKSLLTTCFPLLELVEQETGAHAEDRGDNHQGQHDANPDVAHESIIISLGIVIHVLGQLIKVQVIHAAQQDGHVRKLHRL